jgi:hypothetical protein
MNDDEIGMAWWNSLTEQARAEWSREAGNTGRVKDAWELFKTGNYKNLPQANRASHCS